MTSPLSITCPTCKDQFPVPAEVLNVDTINNQVVVRLDRTDAFGHFTTCAIRRNVPRPDGKTLVPVEGVSASQMVVVPAVQLAGRIHQMLQGDHYIAVGGSRACKLCGTVGQTCLDQLWAKNTACCAGCENGNTHPAPREGDTCSEWGAEHGCKS